MTLWGEIALDGARRSLTVQREYPATPAELWAALTEPERLARWIGRYQQTADGFRLEMGGPDTDAVVDGRVLACEPGRRLLVSWRFSGDGETEARTELEATIAEAGVDRVLLTLTHRRVQAHRRSSTATSARRPIPPRSTPHSTSTAATRPPSCPRRSSGRPTDRRSHCNGCWTRRWTRSGMRSRCPTA